MPKVRVNNIDIYYEVHGEGFPLLLISGGLATIDWWDPNLIIDLSRHFKTIIFDNRGVGQTNDKSQGYTFETLADDTIGLMDSLNIERSHIFGISMSGCIAQDIAVRHANRVEKLVLCSTRCGGHQAIQVSTDDLMKILKGLSNLEDLPPLIFTEEFIKNEPEKLKIMMDIVRKNPISELAIKRQDYATKKFRGYKKLKDIQAPTLIMHGKKDILNPVGNAEIFAKLIPNAKVAIFDNCAHGIYAEAPELFTKTLIEFLK